MTSCRLSKCQYNFCSWTHRLATIHSVQTDNDTAQHCTTVSTVS